MAESIEKWATCLTDGCENRGYAIRVLTEDGAIVACGPCGVNVTNITDIQPEEGTVLPQWILDQLAMQNSGD